MCIKGLNVLLILKIYIFLILIRFLYVYKGIN